MYLYYYKPKRKYKNTMRHIIFSQTPLPIFVRILNIVLIMSLLNNSCNLGNIQLHTRCSYVVDILHMIKYTVDYCILSVGTISRTDVKTAAQRGGNVNFETD